VSEINVSTVYRRRFGQEEVSRQRMWTVLCQDFFQRFVPRDSTVLEVGSGYCEFINAIQAAHKIAVDLNPDLVHYAAPGVEVHIGSSTDLSDLTTGSVDIAFASNFFEHLSRDDIMRTIGELARVLRPGGHCLILQPNYRYCYRDYWMFFDHVTPLDDRSLTEALETNGFRVVRSIPRFLPYTTKSRFPKALTLVRIYLRVPLVWRLFGQQAFMVAEAADPGERRQA
jgi:SAM-dependent methyltransferase